MEHATFVVTDHRDEGPNPVLTRCEDDAHAGATERAELLKAGRFADLDPVNLADVGRRECDELESGLARVIQPLSEWDHRSERRGAGCAGTTREHRGRALRRPRRSPGLEGRQAEALQDAHDRGRGDASIETGAAEAVLPEATPSAWDEMMARPVVRPEP